MPSTMILTMCISVLVKRITAVYHSTFTIGSRCETAEHKTPNSTHRSQKLDTISTTN